MRRFIGFAAGATALVTATAGTLSADRTRMLTLLGAAIVSLAVAAASGAYRR